MSKAASPNIECTRSPARGGPTPSAQRDVEGNELESSRHGRTTASLIAAAVVIELSFLLMHTARTGASQVAMMLLAFVTSGAAFVWLVRSLERVMHTRPDRTALAVIFGGAILFRITLLPLAPASSTDVYRYLWEGVVQAEGFDPYTVPPNDPGLAGIAEARAEIFDRVSHPSIPTIYPPVAQCLFWLNATAFDGSLLGWKLMLLIFDMALAVAGWKLLCVWRLPIWSLCYVLWCPLLLLETYEGGHLDLIGAALIAVALLARARARPMLSGVALGLAFNVKYLWPVLVILLLAFRPGARLSRIKIVVTASVVAVICWIPHWSSIPAALSTVRMFAENWSFNSAVFDVLRMMPGPSWLPAAIVFVVLVALTLLLARRPVGSSWSDVWLMFGAAFLLIPAAFPWYFVWLVPGLLVQPPRWLLVWISVVPMLHVVDWQEHVTGEWQPMPWLWIVVGIVPTILLVMTWWQRVTHRELPRRLRTLAEHRDREREGMATQ